MRFNLCLKRRIVALYLFFLLSRLCIRLALGGWARAAPAEFPPPAEIRGKRGGGSGVSGRGRASAPPRFPGAAAAQPRAGAARAYSPRTKQGRAVATAKANRLIRR